MRSAVACALCLIAAFGGCRPGATREPAGRSSRAEAAAALTAPTTIVLDVAFVRDRAGADGIAESLWSVADEQAVPLAGRTVLERAGLRVGTVGLPLPERVRDRIDELARQAPIGVRLETTLGQQAFLQLGVVQPEMILLQAKAGEGLGGARFPDAQCGMRLQPRRGPDGTLDVHFLPVVQHGPLRTTFRPAGGTEIPRDWRYQESRAEEKLTELEWTMVMPGRGFVVIGPIGERDRTFGGHALCRQSEVGEERELILIRATHPGGDGPLPETRAPGNFPKPFAGDGTNHHGEGTVVGRVRLD